MSASIIVLRNQNCWEERRGTCSSQPSASGVTALSRYTGRISAIFVVGVVSRVRGVSGINALNHGRHTPILSNPLRVSPLRSVIAAESSPGGGLTACGLSRSISVRRRLFQFFPALKVAGDLLSIGFHRTLTVCQDTARKIANVLHFSVLSRLHFHAQQQSMEFDAWRTEKLSLRNTNQGMSV